MIEIAQIAHTREYIIYRKWWNRFLQQMMSYDIAGAVADISEKYGLDSHIKK